jgi:hypothetical protein
MKLDVTPTVINAGFRTVRLSMVYFRSGTWGKKKVGSGPQ